MIYKNTLINCLNLLSNLKIVHLAVSIKGGAGIAAWRLHMALLQAGIDSNFLTLDRKGNLGEKWFVFNDFYKSFMAKVMRKIAHYIRSKKRVPGIGVSRKQFLDTYRTISVGFRPEAFSCPVTEMDISKISLLREADILHLHWVGSIIDFPTFFRNERQKIIWTLHDLNPLLGCFHSKMDEQKWRNGENRSFDGNCKSLKRTCFNTIKERLTFIAPSAYFDNEIKVSLNNGFLRREIPNCFSNILPPEFTKSHARIKLGLDEKGIYMLIIAGHLNLGRKGLDILLDAVRMLKKDISIIAIGKLHKGFELPAQFQHIEFILEEEEKMEYYLAVDAVLIPSREDNLPNVMLEAFSCGTPVITTPVGGLEQYTISGLTGELAQKVDAENFSAAINRFLLNRGNYHAEAIRAFALENFGEKTIVEQHFNVYKD